MNPILLDIPEQLETERLILRGPLAGDGEKIRTAVIASHAELKQWMPWAVNIPSEEEYEVIVRKGRVRFLAHEDLWLLLVHKESGDIIGGSGLHRIEWEVPKFEIGYWLDTRHTGKGYVTEAVQAITAFAFSHLNAERVEIMCDSHNVRSAAVPRRLGFTHEATLRRDSRHHLTQELRDTFLFAMIRPDWEEAQKEKVYFP